MAEVLPAIEDRRRKIWWRGQFKGRWVFGSYLRGLFPARPNMLMWSQTSMMSPTWIIIATISLLQISCWRPFKEHTTTLVGTIWGGLGIWLVWLTVPGSVGWYCFIPGTMPIPRYCGYWGFTIPGTVLVSTWYCGPTCKIVSTWYCGLILPTAFVTTNVSAPTIRITRT